MSEAKHTPGPWYGTKHFVRHSEPLGTDRVGINICTINEALDEYPANLRLITSAPDLLAALKANHEWHLENDDHNTYEGSELYGINLAAIAKAEGVEP